MALEISDETRSLLNFVAENSSIFESALALITQNGNLADLEVKKLICIVVSQISNAQSELSYGKLCCIK